MLVGMPAEIGPASTRHNAVHLLVHPLLTVSSDLLMLLHLVGKHLMHSAAGYLLVCCSCVCFTDWTTLQGFNLLSSA